MDSLQNILLPIIERHREICVCADGTLQESFINKRRYEDLPDALPKTLLRKLSLDDLRSGIECMLDLDKRKVAVGKLGNVFYVMSKCDSSKTPIVYDLLCDIFHNTSQDTRQKLFHIITEEYYNTLTSKVLTNHNLTKTHFDRQIKFFSPFAKLEALYRRCKLSTNGENITNAALELEECILYPQLLREDCYSVLKNLYRRDDYILFSYEVSPTQDLPGHIGKYFQVKIIATITGKLDAHQLFMKFLDSDEAFFGEWGTCLYQKEKAFFQKILPQFVKILTENLTEFCPKYYLATDDIVILQDIAISGYKTWDYYKPVSYEWLTTSVKLLAKMHASSLVYEEKTSKQRGKVVRLDEEFGDAVRKLDLKEDPMREQKQMCIGNALCEYFPTKIPKITEKVPLEDLVKELKVAFNKVDSIGEKSEKFRNVICHGDVWCANVMFKTDENDKIISAYFIDFQLIRYCNPAVDLLFLIYTNSSRSLRLRHMSELLRLYHSELASILYNHNIDIDDIMNYEKLMEACKEVERSVILESIKYSHFILLPKELKKDVFTDSEESQRFFFEDKVSVLEEAWPNETYRGRITEYYEDFVDIMMNKE